MALTAQQIANARVIPLALALLPAKMDTPPARVILACTSLQEAKLTERRQYGNGPAGGLWQFEKGGGVHGVLTHAASKALAAKICADRGVPATNAGVWQAIQTDDVLACVFARLLYWTDARAVPAIGQVQASWDMYLDNWRPGKPKPDTWPAYYAEATKLVATELACACS